MRIRVVFTTTGMLLELHPDLRKNADARRRCSDEWILQTTLDGEVIQVMAAIGVLIKRGQLRHGWPSMNSTLRPSGDAYTLWVDPSIGHDRDLVEQLSCAGFKTDFADSWEAAREAVTRNYYQSCVAIANLDQPSERQQLSRLRRAALRVWMIALTDLQPPGALILAHRLGIDAVLSTPFSTQDLASRLTAFSVRSRPAY
jgi:CheY-like chemotaxis protein